MGLLYLSEIHCSTTGCRKLVCRRGSNSDVVDLKGKPLPLPTEHGAFTVRVECEEGHFNVLRHPADVIPVPAVNPGGKPAVLVQWS